MSKEELSRRVLGKRGNAEFLAKFWMIVAAIIIAFNLLIILTLLQMAPRLKVISQILTSPMSSNQLIQAEPLSSDIGDKKLLDEMLIRYYLEMRLSLFADQTEFNRRIGVGGPVWLLSNADVYRQFLAGFGEEVTQLRNLSYTESVDIQRISRLGNTFTVEFDVVRLLGSTISRESKVSIIEVVHDPSRRVFRTNFANPYGLTVVKYNESKKKQ